MEGINYQDIKSENDAEKSDDESGPPLAKQTTAVKERMESIIMNTTTPGEYYSKQKVNDKTKQNTEIERQNRSFMSKMNKNQSF